MAKWGADCGNDFSDTHSSVACRYAETMESCVVLYEFCDDSLLFTENVGFENKRTKEFLAKIL